jgi:FkbM family methyltransferase
MIFEPYSTAHRLVHNQSACEAVGEALRVTTARQQWAYAVEFPLRVVPPSVDKCLKIKLRARVSEGAIGLGVLTPDGTRYQQEIQVTANDENEAVEIVLEETAALGSLMLRNTASDGASHVEVEIVACELVSNEEVETTEIVVDPEIFRSFRPWSGWVSEGFFADWTGIKTRVDVWAFSADSLEVFNKVRHEKHDVPITGEHVLDWAPLARVVQESSELFRMAALGAGWGRWLAAGSALASQVRRDYRMLGVEAEPQHFEWLLRHFRENGIAQDRYIAVNAAAIGKPGDCWFESGNPQAWYGQSVRSDEEDAREQGVQLRRTKGITIDGVLELLSPLDYMHMDIQGAELDFLSYRPELLDAKVRLVNIGTHSAKNEAGLRQLFTRLGWECLYDVRVGSKHRLRIGDKFVPSVKFGDGVQVWRNPRLHQFLF